MRFDQMLTLAREECQMTVAELAAASGLSRLGIYYLESGQRSPTLGTIETLCKVLGRALSHRIASHLLSDEVFSETNFALQCSKAKSEARIKLSTAVKRGIVKKPRGCTKCGKAVASKNLHAHHKDYEKPLDVSWLCRKCHEDEHHGQ